MDRMLAGLRARISVPEGAVPGWPRIDTNVDLDLDVDVVVVVVA